jgi:translation initiation factor 4E
MAAATLEAPATADNPTSPVDLSTIPISPVGGDSNGDKAKPSGDEQITVFHDPDNFNVKHPLMHKWTLWFTKPPSGKVSTDKSRVNNRQYEANFHRVTTGMTS